MTADIDQPLVDWPAAFLRRVHPRRDRGPVVKWRKPNARKAFREIAESYRDTRDHRLPGRTQAPAAVAGHLGALDRRFRGRPPKAIPAAAEVEEEALLFHVAPYPWHPPTERRVIDYWVATRGLRFAFEAAATALARRDLDPRHWTGGRRLRRANPLGLDRLRRLLASTDDETYATVRRDAAEQRREAKLPLRCALSYLFPTEAAWVEEDLEACLAAGKMPSSGFLLAYSLHREAQLARLCDPRGILSRGQLKAEPTMFLLEPFLDAVPSILHALGGGAVEPLAELFDRVTATLDLELHQDIAKRLSNLDQAMARIPGDRAMAALIGSGRDVALEKAAARFPDRAVRHLAPRAIAGDDDALRLVRSLLAGQPATADPLASLDDEIRRRLAKLLEPADDAAALDALPEVLRRPPWEKPPRAREPRVVTGLTVLDEPHRMSWAAGQKERFETLEYEPPPHALRLARTPDADLAEQVARIHDRGVYHYGNWLPWLVASCQLPLLPLVLLFRKRSPGIMARALGPYDSVQAAPAMADLAHRYRNLSGKRARRWLIDHPQAAAIGLVPAAVGPPGTAREAATAALALVIQAGHREVVEDAAVGYGEEVRSALDVLDVDPLTLGVPETLPEMPRFWDPAKLPSVRLATGETLPHAAVEHLGALLAISPPDCPDLRLEQVRAACDRRSLAAFVRELFETWLRLGAEAGDKWAFYALGRFGDDEAARRIEPLIREWPRQGGHQKAVIGLEVLAMIGTDFALMQLHGIALAARQKGIQKEARKAIDRLAADRGLSSEELADRLVPDLGLDEGGSRVLDYGHRLFMVGFDEALKPFVTSSDGRRYANAPRPGKRDDAAVANAAYDDWKALKKQLRTVARQQITRLELAMCHQRRWKPHDFRRLVVGHPLLIHLARRLLWGVWEDESLAATFRVDEDRSLADVDEETFTLQGDGAVGLVHRLDLDDATVERWREIFADYELIPPFEQLEREIFLPTAKERKRGELDRFNDTVVHPGRLLGLTRRGWRRGRPIDDGVVWWMARPFDRERELRLGFEPGFAIYDPAGAPEQTVLGTWLTHTTADSYDDQPRGAFRELEPMQLSEALRDLEELRRTGG